ncbi:hypothetical protein [uncultured Umboniibacter sp.]|uniref:hypothetical protein n=1 Tax=uncultured Umboniibacter sp. TaxID=1798917 RepID=UPI00260BA1E1|nr:hypothetical protein [uncultured Umboniibacter sp.]
MRRVSFEDRLARIQCSEDIGVEIKRAKRAAMNARKAVSVAALLLSELEEAETNELFQSASERDPDLAAKVSVAKRDLLSKRADERFNDRVLRRLRQEMFSIESTLISQHREAAFGGLALAEIPIF